MGLRVVTFNIRHGEALSGHIDLEAQAKLLRSLQADAVFLQEVDVGTQRSGGTNQARALAELAGFSHFAFGKCRECDGGAYGNAILSRFSPLEVSNTLIPTPDPLRPRPWRNGSYIYLEQRAIIRVTVEVDGQPVHLICSHFGFLAEERPPSARLLLDLSEPLEGTVIAGGDLNARPDSSEEIRLLRDALVDCALATGQDSAKTFPADDPRARLDYLFVRGACAPVAAAVVPTLTSDHRPVVADLVMMPRPLICTSVTPEPASIPRNTSIPTAPVH